MRASVGDGAAERRDVAAIVLSHPSSNPNARWTALALERVGALEAVYTSFDARAVPGLRRLIGEGPYARRVWTVERRRVRSTFLPDALGRVVARLGRSRAQGLAHDLAYVLHDELVARRLAAPLDALYAFEDGAARSFAAARRMGAVTLLELPAGDHLEVRARSDAMVQAGRGPAFFAEPAWKLQRKEDEIRQADVLVAASRYVADALRRRRPDKDVVVAPYAMPVDEFAPRVEPRGGPLQVGFVGALSSRKGVVDLLEAWRALAPSLRAGSLTLVGARTVDHDRVEPLMRGVRWIPSASRREIGEILRGLDVLVLPSWCDGYGLVIGEALACGTPVIATRTTGAAGVITEGREGWSFEAGDVDALARLLGAVLEAPERVRRMRPAARELAEQWAPARVLPRNAEAIRAAVARARTRARGS